MPSPVVEKILSCPSLPSLPAVAVEVLRITKDPSVKLSAIAKVVQNDASLSAKILKTVNSSLYGLKERCTRIDRALGLMGMNAVKSIVLGFSIVDSTRQVKDGNGFDISAYWRRTIFGAAAARQMAIETRACDPDEAFTAGLFQDIGVLAAVTAMRDEYAGVLGSAPSDPAMLSAHEEEMLGFDHATVGAELAMKWSLPEQYVDCIRSHHAAQHYSGKHEAIVRVVALGSFAAAAMSNAESSKQMARLRIYGEKWFGRTAELSEPYLAASSKAAGELAKLFEKNVGQSPDIGAIMAEAAELSMENQLVLQKEAEELRQANQTLSIQTLTDTLTKVPNRRRFDQEIARVFAESSEQGRLVRPVSVLFTDADKFKSINDTHGHPAGDAVLVELGRRLTEAVGESGVVARFGGEEFAVLLPGCPPETATAVAERVRAGVGSTPFDTSHLPGVPPELKVTVSVGVATAGPGEPQSGLMPDTTSADGLVKAADEAVYVAKQRGRNCVCVCGQRAEAKEPVATAQPVSVPPPASADSPPMAASAPASVPTQTGAADGAMVLIVDDDPLAAALLQAVLQRSTAGGKPRIVTATSVAQAKEWLAKGHVPHLVVCDLNMPEHDGLVLVGHVRSTEGLNGVPVVIVSADSTEQTAARCIGAGATAFIAKTELAKDLTKCVSRIMELSRVPIRRAA